MEQRLIGQQSNQEGHNKAENLESIGFVVILALVNAVPDAIQEISEWWQGQ